MLRIIQNSTASGAKSYYSQSDYLTEGQELAGIWRGKGAQRLGLAGEVQKDDWDRLCDNRNPSTGAVLTPRQKSNRRVGYDFNFHVPKSVSLLYGLTGDERIERVFREAVGETMMEMESEMMTRVRSKGRNEDRATGNLVWGEFVHTTSRPVGGIPDPHLHAHCFVFNSTFDGVEDRWKAGQFAGIKRDSPYFEAVFHSRLASKLDGLGLPIERQRNGWEIAGLSRNTLTRYSRRTALIEELARQEGLVDDALKDGLGARTRERKQKRLGLGELRQEWWSRLSADEGEGIRVLANAIGGVGQERAKRSAREATGLALEHCFERSAVVAERKVLTEALKRSFGDATPESVNGALAAADLIGASMDGQRVVTTPGVLEEEQQMIEFARSGRGRCRELGSRNHSFHRKWLNDGQRAAVRHVLESPDRVLMIRGAAGVGKTSMMKEAVEAIEVAGTRVFTFAPSADASRGVLREEGFGAADTVARLLVDERLQEEVSNSVIWVDEAGQLGTRTMSQLFELAEQKGARVILSGDRKQHGSVERGAVLRLLEEEAGVRPAEIKDIQRQRDAYKEAVQALT